MKKLIYLLFVCFTTITHAQVLFQKTYGNFEVNKIVQTTDSGHVMLSTFSNSFQNVLLVKTNALGDTLWTRAIGDSGLRYVNYDVTPADNGSCVVLIGVGSYNFMFYTVHDTLLLIKFDSSGNWLWDKAYYVAPNPNWLLGWSGWTTKANVIYTNDGGYLLSASQTLSGSAGPANNYEIRLNSVGDTLWTRFKNIVCEFTLQSPDSGFVMGGTWPFTVPFNRIGFSKMDKWGNLLWSYKFQNSILSLPALKQTHDGGYILAGHYSQVNSLYIPLAYLIRTNSLGDTLWTRGYDIGYSFTDQIFSDVIETPDGGFIACGDDILIKTDSLGILVWAYQYTFGNINTKIEKILPGYDGGYILEGYKSDSVTTGTRFIAKIDSSGNSNCVHTPFTWNLGDFSIWISGGPMTDIDTIVPAVTLSYNISSGDSLVDVQAFCQPTGIESVSTTANELTVYPNPAASFININAADHLKSEILITDMLGKELHRQTSVRLPLQINTSSFPEGMYNVSLINKEGISYKKFIVSR